jgi:protein-tyrosine-phosphatase
VTGVIGVEIHGNAGLLRSLAVTQDRRGTGIGAELVEQLERACREQGIGELVLLTQTAEPFFARRGYIRAERTDVSAPIRTSAEFRSLCPASATCMRKPLAARKRVLFVCVENANRSQMAEAFAHIHGGDAVFATSAGSLPSGQVNPRAVRFMSELGYDLTRHRSKSLDEIGGEFDAVVTMGCGDRCPWVPARQRFDWNLPDPKHLPDDEYRAVRDAISLRVRELLERL